MSKIKFLTLTETIQLIQTITSVKMNTACKADSVVFSLTQDKDAPVSYFVKNRGVYFCSGEIGFEGFLKIGNLWVNEGQIHCSLVINDSIERLKEYLYATHKLFELLKERM